MIYLEDGVQPAQLLIILKLTSFDNSACSFFAIVRYLKVSEGEQPNAQLQCPFTISNDRR